VIPVAHIAGIPVEETVVMLVPVFAVGVGALTATLRGRLRRQR
jgi:hypothetical protein